MPFPFFWGEVGWLQPLPELFSLAFYVCVFFDGGEMNIHLDQVFGWFFSDAQGFLWYQKTQQCFFEPLHTWKGRARTDWNNLKMPPKLGTSPRKTSILGGSFKKEICQQKYINLYFLEKLKKTDPNKTACLFRKKMLWSYILWWILVAKKALLEGGLLKWLIQRRHRGAQGRSRLRFLEKTTGRWGKMDS